MINGEHGPVYVPQVGRARGGTPTKNSPKTHVPNHPLLQDLLKLVPNIDILMKLSVVKGKLMYDGRPIGPKPCNCSNNILLILQRLAGIDDRLDAIPDDIECDCEESIETILEKLKEINDRLDSIGVGDGTSGGDCSHNCEYEHFSLDDDPPDPDKAFLWMPKITT